MKQTLTTSQAAHMLIDDKNANWSRAGAYALCEYLEQLEEVTGEEMEFCHVAIRCDYSEHESLWQWAVDYFGGNSNAIATFPEEDEEERDEKIREYIQDHGTLIGFDGGIIVSSF